MTDKVRNKITLEREGLTLSFEPRHLIEHVYLRGDEVNVSITVNREESLKIIEAVKDNAFEDEFSKSLIALLQDNECDIHELVYVHGLPHEKQGEAACFFVPPTTETIMVCRLKQIVGAMSEGVIFCPSISLEEYQDMQVLPDEKRQEQCFNTAIYWLGSGEAERAYQDIVFQRIVLAGGLN